MSLHVLLHHPVLLPAVEYGGTERVVIWLAKALGELGHRVSIVCRGSGDLPHGATRVSPEKFFELSQIAGGVRDQLKVEIVHFMATPSPSEYELLGCPYLVTIHGNGKPGEVYLPNTVFVSEDHAHRHGRSEFVHNGVDPVEYVSSNIRDRSFRFLSKTSWPVKNLRGALDICEAAGEKLEIAGGNRPYGLRVRAFLRGHPWWGPVDQSRKQNFLSRGRGLIFPVLWDEPFGLVVVEAWMSGMPVFAPKRGSLGELLTPEVGVLMSKTAPMDEWVSALQSADRFSAAQCREFAISRFSHLVMAQNYLKKYRSILNLK